MQRSVRDVFILDRDGLMAVIDELQATVAAQQTTIAGQQATIATQQVTIAQYEISIAELTRRIQELQNQVSKGSNPLECPALSPSPVSARPVKQSASPEPSVTGGADPYPLKELSTNWTNAQIAAPP